MIEEVGGGGKRREKNLKQDLGLGPRGWAF